MPRDRRILGPIALLISLTVGLVGVSTSSVPAGAAAEEPGRITGTVTGPGGVRLEGASVAAYPVHCPNGCDAYGGSTDVDGAYAIENLPPGTYVLRFQGGFEYLGEYYDNVIGQQNATPVVVAAGSTVSGTNAQLERGGHLTGTVTGRGGHPLKDIAVRAYRKEGGTWQFVGETSTAPDGDYRLDGSDGLLGGTYRIEFSDYAVPGYVLQYYGGASTLKDATNVVMGENETVTRLDARMSWPRTLRAVKAPKVTGKPRAGATVRLFPGTWSPSKVKVVVYGWYADDVHHLLDGQYGTKIRLTGRTLARARGHRLLVRFRVSAPGYISVIRTLTVPGGAVSG